ncbi:c-type cytochrome [Vibrio aphrogenes]|uniref:c-type cytochrome n=1 Tax=Vibrio aphrogenes TaxID=1891186 RepID=UPI000B35AF6B|nr:c-type cytochrome [Vibrio aphrogenes]
MKYLLLSLSLLSAMTWAETGHTDLAQVEPGKALAEGENYHQVPDWNAIPEEHFAEAVKRGYSIFMNSQQMKSDGAVGNGLNCTNCHLSAGRLANSAPLWGAYVSYPAYRGKNNKINTYEDRLQGCFAYSMNGKPPAATSQEILDLTAYSYWLATDAKVNAKISGRGFPKAAQPKLAPDFIRGQEVYKAECALCHGDNGEGRKVGERYVFPPLWGKDSYNWGAGMHQISSAANFIKANMPLSKGNSLTDQQAWDVSTFINSHERPQDPRVMKSVAETAKQFHAKDSLYGTPSPVDQHILGTKAY